MKSDIEIAQEAEKFPIEKVAENAGIPYDSLELYGKYKAKLSEDYLKGLSGHLFRNFPPDHRFPRQRKAADLSGFSECSFYAEQTESSGTTDRIRSV